MNRRTFNRRWIEINEKSIDARNRREEELLRIRREELYMMRKRNDREVLMLSETKLKKYVINLIEEILMKVDDDEIEEKKTCKNCNNFGKHHGNDEEPCKSCMEHEGYPEYQLNWERKE